MTLCGREIFLRIFSINSWKYSEKPLLHSDIWSLFELWSNSSSDWNVSIALVNFHWSNFLKHIREGYLIAFVQDHQLLETPSKIFLTIGSLEQRLVISLTQSIGHDIYSSGQFVSSEDRTFWYCFWWFVVLIGLKIIHVGNNC